MMGAGGDRQLAQWKVEARFAGAKLPWLFLFAMGFFLAYKQCDSFHFQLTSASWFPDSVLLCALLIVPRRQWWLYFGPSDSQLLKLTPVRRFGLHYRICKRLFQSCAVSIRPATIYVRPSLAPTPRQRIFIGVAVVAARAVRHY
jgi:hypothetical protein